MKRYVFVLLLILISVSARAAGTDGTSAMIGSISCGRYVENRKNQVWGQNEYWVAGYITAYNLWTPDTWDILGTSDLDSAMLWLETYCKANPLESLGMGMHYLINELRPKRHRSAKEAGK